MKKYLFTLLLLLPAALTWAQGYKPGDKAIDFKLKNIDGRHVSLADYPEAKGFIVVFTCNHCPFSKMYEDRIIALDKKYKPLGYPVIAINPNDPKKQPEDSFDKMIERAKEKGFTFPYLFDETQEVARTYGATNTPHVFVLKKEGKDLIVSYIGAIDDSPRDASKASKKYVEQAVDALLNGKEVEVKQAKAIGCTIKWREM
ncbi:MAG: thioredoxin family protein [Thermonema sp.]|uniref:thioredoxin family protein n=1 Tax=Thermonema TaxID=28194 RepID=UPI00056E16A2|nr:MULTISPECIES: thioredoxin family protein [Thermonema]GIV39739.1 MAG: thioredoxin family protein [Thermonema sp.]